MISFLDGGDHFFKSAIGGNDMLSIFFSTLIQEAVNNGVLDRGGNGG